MITKTDKGYEIDGITLTSMQAWELREFLGRECKRDYIVETYPHLDSETVKNLIAEWENVEEYDDENYMTNFGYAYDRIVGREEKE